jgi:hypothetical protein
VNSAQTAMAEACRQMEQAAESVRALAWLAARYAHHDDGCEGAEGATCTCGFNIAMARAKEVMGG